MPLVNATETPDIAIDFASGNEVAFRYIYDKYNPLLRYFAFRYLEDKNYVNDIIQEVFIKLWEVRKIFKEEKSIKSYLYKSTKSLCLNQLRHNKVEDKYISTMLQEDQQDFFLDNLLETELFSKLTQAFSEIPSACKEVYELSLSGMKHEEIASTLNISVNSVKKYKNRANHYMKERMKVFFPF